MPCSTLPYPAMQHEGVYYHDVLLRRLISHGGGGGQEGQESGATASSGREEAAAPGSKEHEGRSPPGRPQGGRSSVLPGTHSPHTHAPRSPGGSSGGVGPSQGVRASSSIRPETGRSKQSMAGPAPAAAAPPPATLDSGSGGPAGEGAPTISARVRVRPGSRKLPEEEAEMSELLRAMEEQLVFGQHQQDRTEALYLAQQLRQALADLARVRRQGDKSRAVHRHGLRLDIVDAEGLRHRPRAEEGAAVAGQRRGPTAEAEAEGEGGGGGGVRHSGGVASNVAVAGRGHGPHGRPRAHVWSPPQMHPDRPDPDRQVDSVTWRPATAKVALKHPSGWRAAGDARGVGWWGIACTRGRGGGGAWVWYFGTQHVKHAGEGVGGPRCRV